MAIRIRIYPQSGSFGVRRRRQQQRLEQRMWRQQVRFERQHELLRRQQLQASMVPVGYGTAGLGMGYGAAYGGFGSGIFGAAALGGFPAASSWGMVARSPWSSALAGSSYLPSVAQVAPGYGTAYGSYGSYGSYGY